LINPAAANFKGSPILSTSSALTTLVITNAQSLIELADEWRALENPAAPHQAFDYCVPFIENNPHSARPYVLVAYQDGALKALLPLALFVKGSRIILTGLCEPEQLSTQILLSNNADVQEVMAAFLPAMQESGADYVHLGQVANASPLAQGASQSFIARSRTQDGADYLLPLTLKGQLYGRVWLGLKGLLKG
jgi:hypothetical protein